MTISFFLYDSKFHKDLKITSTTLLYKFLPLSTSVIFLYSRLQIFSYFGKIRDTQTLISLEVEEITMKSSVLSVFVVVLFVFVSAQLSLSVGDEHDQPLKYISWEDMRFEEIRRTDKQMEHGNHGVIVVAKDGTGDSVTVQGAVDMVPSNNNRRVKILIHPGIYREKVYVPRDKPYISFVGNQSRQTVITWNSKASDKDDNGEELGTFRTATVDVQSDYFCATGITVQNTIVAHRGGIGMQAVAFRIDGDKAVFYNVRFLGAQDTLLDLSGSHYFYKCYIEGTVDFIFGNARSLYEECVIHSIAKKSGAIAAHHRNSMAENTGYSFQNCVINGTGRIYLARAWGPYSTVIYSHCHIENIITPQGWTDWGYPSRRQTVSFGAYKCTGRGASARRWVRFAKLLSFREARPYLGRKYIDGNEWLRLPYSRTPVY